MNEPGTEKSLPPYPQEEALIDFLPHIEPGALLCTSLGRAQFAKAAASKTNSHITCHFIDLYRANIAKETIALQENITIECSSDFPERIFDVVAMPTSATGEAELTRDFLQQGYERLKQDGQIIVSTDNKQDAWLREQINHVFGNSKRHSHSKGAIYEAIKKGPLKKVKDFSSTFAFRDQGRLIHAVSRPGVFSHRHIDEGARALITAMEIKDNNNVLDIGCGWGAVSLAAAGRAKHIQVEAIDSNARAIECTAKNALRNSFNNIHTTLTADGNLQEPGTFDLVLANPPYYANFRIAQLFAQTGAKALRDGGVILFVTKFPNWYQTNLPRWFKNVSVEQLKKYSIIKATTLSS